MHQNQNKNIHIPVLLPQTLAVLDPRPGERYLDLTAGYGGHASAVLARTKAPAKATLIDRDEHAVTRLVELFGESGVEIIRDDYWAASQQLINGRRQYDVILADLGVSSPHLNQSSRGFSFAHDGPLDMRMDQRQTLSAAMIVNEWPEADIAAVLSEYGEEPKAKQIAGEIVRRRPLSTTAELAEVAAGAWHGYSRVHPATRTFQALRIAVNDELGQLERSLPLWLELLAPNGRLAVISFHSLEDRLVKNFFTERAGDRYDAELQLLTKHPITASADEIVSNPRARSAKLRAVANKHQKERSN